MKQITYDHVYEIENITMPTNETTLIEIFKKIRMIKAVKMTKISQYLNKFSNCR